MAFCATNSLEILPAHTEQNQQEVLQFPPRNPPALPWQHLALTLWKHYWTEYIRPDLPLKTHYLHSNSKNLNTDEKGFIITLSEIEPIP